ncbi:MAG TPA: DNA-binding protein H-NS-like protein [Pasteurellaceae bacterium]|nr:DNA-binding protein H-NS-like protein [Pasteurellaceae bacterium]
MRNLLKTLNNIRTLRNTTRELTIEQLENVVEKLQLVISEKRDAVEQRQREEQERKDRIKKYKELLKKDGITPAELAEILSDKTKAKKKRDARPAKYKYTDENGQVKTWTGQGRTPKAIQTALNSGKKLSSFKI